jgi:LysM repeat protein
VRAAEIQGVDTVMVGKLPLPAPTQATIASSTIAPTTDAPTTIARTSTVPSTPAPTEAVVVTPAPTQPATTAAKKVAPKSTTTVAPASSAAQSAEKAPCALTYTVVKNDTWSTIASRAKVSMKSVLAANAATINTLLLPGKSICLPTGAVAPAPPTTNAPATTQPATTQPKSTTTQPKSTTTRPTTPPPTTAPPTTQPAPPPNTYTKAQVAQIIRDVWPDDLEDEAIRIATRESNLIPTVHNYCCYGLFQIYYTAHKTWLAGMGITSASQLYDPRVNATAALALYNTSGWSPWATTPTTTVA